MAREAAFAHWNGLRGSTKISLVAPQRAVSIAEVAYEDFLPILFAFVEDSPVELVVQRWQLAMALQVGQEEPAFHPVAILLRPDRTPLDAK